MIVEINVASVGHEQTIYVRRGTRNGVRWITASFQPYLHRAILPVENVDSVESVDEYAGLEGADRAAVRESASIRVPCRCWT